MAMLNMIGGGGAGSVTAGLLSQAPETWNPALYQLAVSVHEVAVKPLTSVVLYVRFIELYALTAFQSLPFAFLVHEDTKPIGVGFFKSYARTSVNAVCVFVCLVFYQRIVVDAVRIPDSADKGMVSWVTGNFGNLMMAGILLFFVIAVSQRVSRAIAGGE